MSTDESVFRDPDSDDAAVARAAARMADEGAPATLWADVANDPSRRPLQRALAIRQLFERHLARPATLGECASLLAGGRWLLDAVVEKVEQMGGEIPVRVPAGGSAFIIRLRGGAGASGAEFGLYLALDRDIDAGALRGVLTSESADPSLRQIRVVDFAFFP